MRFYWRTILLLGMVSLFTDISSEMILPILPIFLAVTLSASPFVIGLIEGFAESIGSILKLVSGYFSDRLRRRKAFIIGGYSMSSVSKLFLGFSRFWVDVFALRVLDRSGKGVRTAPRDAVIASSADVRKRGKAFGVHRALDTTGAIIGPILLLLLISAFSYRDIFFIAVIPAILAVLALLFLKEPPIAKEKPKASKISYKGIPRELRFFIIIATIFALGNFSYAFFILKVVDSGFDPTLVIYLYLLFNIVYAAASIPMGSLSDKVGRKPVISLSYLLFGLTCLGFMISSSIINFVLLFIMYGLFNAAVESSQRAYVSDLSNEDLRGTALGTYHMVTSIAILPSSVIAGLLWNYVSLEAMFLFGFSLAIAALLLFILKGKKR